MIGGEISRITDHLTCLGMAAQELGAITAGFYMIEARELLCDIVEAITGARLTVTYCRIGGVMNDLPADIARPHPRRAFKNLRGVLADCDKLLSRNRIFVDRMEGVGAHQREGRDLAAGSPGRCCARPASPTTCARREPYLVYDRFDFEVPIGTRGDNYDRFLVRFAEMRAEHAHHRAGAGADPRRARSCVDDPRFVLPPKQEVYGSHRGPDGPLQARHRGRQDPAGRGLRRPPRAATASSASTS